MFKLTKYEFRKNITAPVILLVIVGLLEVVLLTSLAFESEKYSVLAYSLQVIIMFFSFFMILILSIISYSRELKSKSSYMTFMAPLSSYQIIGSKLLTTFIFAAIAGILFFLLLPMNAAAISSTFEEVGSFLDALKELMDFFDYNWTKVIINGAMILFELMISFYFVVALAYFAISLSSTVFQNKKFKWIFTSIVFIALYSVATYVAFKLPTIGEPTTLVEAFIGEIPMLSFYLACIIGGYIGSAMLLEKKISL